MESRATLHGKKICHCHFVLVATIVAAYIAGSNIAYADSCVAINRQCSGDGDDHCEGPDLWDCKGNGYYCVYPNEPPCPQPPECKWQNSGSYFCQSQLDCGTTNRLQNQVCTSNCSGGECTPGQTRTIVVGTCDFGPCCTDCQVSEWACGECEGDCGTTGFMQCTRWIIQQPNSCGEPCPSLEKAECCEMPDCPMAELTYSKQMFVEAAFNNGSIDNFSQPLLIELTGGTFSGSIGDDFMFSKKVTVTNLSQGLFPVILKLNDTTLLVLIFGNALSHTVADDVADLTFSFDDSAFNNLDAADVKDSLKDDLVIDFF